MASTTSSKNFVYGQEAFDLFDSKWKHIKAVTWHW